jgi:hypothetical protein
MNVVEGSFSIMRYFSMVESGSKGAAAAGLAALLSW